MGGQERGRTSFPLLEFARRIGAPQFWTSWRWLTGRGAGGGTILKLEEMPCPRATSVLHVCGGCSVQVALIDGGSPLTFFFDLFGEPLIGAASISSRMGAPLPSVRCQLPHQAAYPAYPLPDQALYQCLGRIGTWHTTLPYAGCAGGGGALRNRDDGITVTAEARRTRRGA